MFSYLKRFGGFGGLSFRVLTLSVEFGELLGQSVLTFLQLPLLLLHVLHVIGQRLDLRLVLKNTRERKKCIQCDFK